jgi:hypothetical protein
MKIRYLLFPLLAASAQSSLAAEPGTSAATANLAPAVGPNPVRVQDLQRVADAMAAETGRPAGANTRETVEAMKARIKGVKHPSRPADPADCTDCPDKDAARQPHSASEAHDTDCIHCAGQAAFV